MKNIQVKNILLILLCTVLSVVIVGGLSITTSNDIIEASSRENLTLQCKNTAGMLNNILDSIMQSVDTLSEYALDSLDDMEKFKTDKDYVEEYTQKIKQLSNTLAANTESCVSVYIRYNQDYAGAEAGSFLVLDKETGNYKSEPLTDISMYDEDDMEHVGWFYKPIKNRKPTWLEPYMNKNINVYMVSYVVPLYKNGETIGIVGMDIDFEYIKNYITDISFYKTGYAFLLNNDNQIIVHKDYIIYTNLSDLRYEKKSETIGNDGTAIGKYDYNGIERAYASIKLDNGMVLFMSAPTYEIFADTSALTTKIIIIGVISFAAVAVIAWLVMNKVMRVASIDELTRLPNRKLFIEKFNRCQNITDYSIFLLDIDYFKSINDKLGHNMGDTALKELAKTAQKTLGKNTLIARWGGDEFIGLIPTIGADTALERLRWRLEKNGDMPCGKLTISIGLVQIKEGYSVNQMTELADKALYKSKSEGKNRLSVIEK